MSIKLSEADRILKDAYLYLLNEKAGKKKTKHITKGHFEHYVLSQELAKARKETAEKILNEQYQECKVAEKEVLIARGGNKNDDYYKGFSLGMANTKMHIQELAKQFGVDLKGERNEKV